MGHLVLIICNNLGTLLAGESGGRGAAAGLHDAAAERHDAADGVQPQQAGLPGGPGAGPVNKLQQPTKVRVCWYLQGGISSYIELSYYIFLLVYMFVFGMR